MEQEEIRQLWAEGEDWILKRSNNEYFHRPDGKYGEWQPGLFSPVTEAGIRFAAIFLSRWVC